jgi:hypothetical protein
MYTIAPTRYSGLIDSKPPPDLGVYTAAHEHLPLYDSYGVATGYAFAIGWHFVEHDHFESWPQRVEIITPDSTVVQANVDGSMEQDVFFESGEGDAVDDDSDNRDEVATELVDLNLTGSSVLGPLSVRLNPSFASTGEIEETSDIITGRLDLPPFTVSGTAASFFDAYFEVTVDGQTMYTIAPTRYSGVIDSKPAGDLGVYTTAHKHLPLYDSYGVATGYAFAIGWHFVEHDYFESWPQRVELILADSTVVQANVDGSMRQDVFFEPAEGDAVDDDGDSKDEVVMELTDLDLTGDSVLGPVSVRLNPSIASTGEIEETSDIVTGRLDLSPFAMGGTAASFFDAYFKVTVNGQAMYTIAPTRYSGVIDSKPASDLGVYTAVHEHLPLYDSFGRITGYSFAIGEHPPEPVVEHDYWESWSQRVEIILPDSTAMEPYVDGYVMQDVFFEGPLEGDANDDDGDNKDEVVTELVDLHLTGNSVLGPVSVRLNPSIASTGEIEEWSNSVPGRLDLPPFSASGAAMAFFDAYFEVTVGGQPMYTISPTRYSGLIYHKPPSDLDVYTAVHSHLPLYDSNGVATDYAFAIGPHSSEPAVETDVYDSAWASVRIQFATGGIETVDLSGSMTEIVYFDGPSEGDADDGNGDGRDEVDTEIVSLHLTGPSINLGTVELRLYPDSSSDGEMTEVVNHTPGILDVAPFTMGEHVTNRMELYVVIEFLGRDYYGDGALVLTGQISYKPARSGELFVDEDELGVDLLDAAGRPTGYRLWITQFRPSPCVRCGNFDGLGVTDWLDVKRFSEEWLWNDSGIEKYNTADMDCSGDVRFSDFAWFANLWLATCDE